MIIKDPTNLPAAPANAPRVMSKAEIGFLDEINDRFVKLLDPATETHVPVLLSGSRESCLGAFLEDGLNKLHESRRVTDLVVFTPGHVDGVLSAQCEAFEALFPALKDSDMDDLPPRFWSSLVKAEMGKQSPKRTRRVIVVDHLEELFEANVAEADRAAFLKNLIEIAQSYATSVVLVVDHALIGQCDELHELKASLGTRFHVRVPVSGQPASAPATEITDWSKFSTKDADETPTPEPVAKTAVEVAIEPSPETPELVPIPEIVTNPEKVPAPTKGFDSAALKLDDETAEDPNELLFPVDPVPISSSVAGNSESFWRQMTWVWMAGYGVALIMIVGLVILGTSAPDPAETDEPEATAAADSQSGYPGNQTQVTANATAPDRRLTPVSASAANPPRKPLDSAALEAAILEFEADDSSAMLPDRLNKAFTGDAKIWLTRARRSKACLATELGRLYSLVSLKTHDNAKALHWFEQAAAQGCPEGGFYAGQALFFATTGIERDPVRAVDHFLASAQFGESRSAYLMGVCRLLGDGVLRNSSIAEEWLKRSISLGGIEAFQELAMMRERGIGNSVDLPAAAELYRTGAEAGNRYCMEKCIQLLAEATGEESKRDAAAEIWRQRASQSEINELQLQVRALAPGLYR